MPEAFINEVPIVSGKRILTIGKLFEGGEDVMVLRSVGIPHNFMRTVFIKSFKVDKAILFYEDAKAHNLR